MSVKGTTSDVKPAEAVRDLLESADSSVWTGDTPDVFLWWEREQNERGPGEGQAPHLYTWQPTTASLERVSADNTLLTEEPTVEVYIYSLSESTTGQLSRDVINYLSEFMSDNYNNSEFADLQPTNVEDFREQKITQKTDQYVYTVECQIQREQETGV